MSFLSCRVCANTPFASVFGAQDSQSSTEGSRPSRGVSLRQGPRPVGQASVAPVDRPEGVWEARNNKEIEDQKKLWAPHTHPRLRDLWKDKYDKVLNKSLNVVGACTDRRDDPIFGSADACVIWHGTYSLTQEPVMQILKIDEELEMPVIRALAFMFVDDESFEAMFGGSTGAAKAFMSCSNSRCVNLQHVVLPDDTA